MTAWPRRLVPVPTTALWVDPSIAPESPKGYTAQDLRHVVKTIPHVYDCIDAGALSADFQAMRTSGDPAERQIGETYALLFSDSPSRAPMTAHYDGTNLIVDNGNHRVRAAYDADIRVLPVWVSASTTAELDVVEQACARRRDREAEITRQRPESVHTPVTAPRHQQERGDRDGHSFETSR